MAQPKKKFKSKVLSIFFLISLLPVLIIAFSNLYLVIKTRQQNITELQSLAAENLSEKIVKHLEQKIENLNLVVTGNISSINELPANSLYFLLFNSFVHSRPNSMDLIDEKGYTIVKARDRDSFFYSREYLAQFDDGETLLQDNKGNLLEKKDLASFSRIEAYVGESADYLAAVSGESYYGRIEMKEGKPVMRLAAQIRNSDERIIGVVSAEIDLKAIDLLAGSMKLGEEGYMYVLDSRGDVIGSANKRIAEIGDNFSDIPRIGNILSENSSELIYAENLSGNRVVVYDSKIEKLNWRIISEWPIKDAFKVIGNILYGSLLVSFAILILVIIIASYFTGKIIKPINTLSLGAKKISEGDLDHSIELKTNDEFEVLGNQFNEMIKILKENRKLRDEFVFIAAHELRTPVTAIKGYVSMMIDGTFGEIPPKINEVAGIINKSNDRLVQLVQDLLEVARSESGKMKIEINPVNISEQVKGVINELDSLAKEKNIVIDYKSEKKYKVLADEYKLNEVLVNLIGNAIKYTLDKGNIEISHEVKGEKIITHIKDHGMGMTSEQMAKLFTKFYRVQTDETRKIEGTGLGLFICKEIVERMGGEIWVKSEAGKGSVFSFSLKIAA